MKVLVFLLVVLGVSTGFSAEKTDEKPALSWGLHEPLKGCVPCHANRPDTNSTEKPGLAKPMPQLCYDCHNEYIMMDAWKHGPVATGECLLCHESHQSEEKSLLVNSIPALCYNCHEPKMLRLIPDHAKPSYSACTTCHEAHASPGRMLLKQAYLETDEGQAYMSKNSSARPRPIFVDSRGSLYGLKGVDVVTMLNGSDSLNRYGVTEKFVRTNVKEHLQRNGIKILSDSEENVRESSLHVRVRLIGVPSARRPGQTNALSASINIYLQQVVELPGTDPQGRKRFCTATTWETGAIALWGITQAKEGVNEAAKILVDRFGKDFHAANTMDLAAGTGTQENAK